MRLSKWQNVHFWTSCSLKAEGSDPQRSLFYVMEVSAVRLGKCAQRVTARITVLWLRGNLEKKPWSKAVISLRQREIYTLQTHCYQRCGSKVCSSPPFFLHAPFHSVHLYCSSLKGIVHHKENCVIVFSSSCSSKPTDFLSSLDEKSWRMYGTKTMWTMKYCT